MDTIRKEDSRMKTRIMITGGCGFIGSHVVEHLLVNTDWEIVILDKLTYASSGFDRLRDLNCFNVSRVLPLQHDFTQPFPKGIEKEIGQLDYIIHMGAETHVDRSLQDALPFAISNVTGTTNILEWVKKSQKNLKRYVQFSTDEVYGAAPDGVFYNEWDTMRPSNPYAASKAGADMMAFAFYHAFKVPVTITRTMNCVGERQDVEKFVPKTIRAIVNDEKVLLHGISASDISSRCWLHARNAADALLFLLQKDTIGDMFHIVGEEMSVLQVADIICQEIKGRDLRESEINFVDFHTARPGHDKRYAMSGAKLRNFGWKPKVSLEQSLRKTVQWSLEHKEWLEL
jgi:dTDP-glucose 4,6-dehydratase